MIIFFVYRFLSQKIRIRHKNASNPCTFLAAFLQYKYNLGDVIDIKSTTYDNGISLKEEANVSLSNHIDIKTFVYKTLFIGYKTYQGDPLLLMSV